MNQDQVLSAVRWAISFGGGLAVGKGWLSADQVTMLVGVAAAVVPFIWSMFVHKAT